MACIKCGKKTKNEQTFCPRCLEVMESYPVKTDVHIQLPNRPDAPVRKAARKRRAVPAEELVPVLRRRLRRLALIALSLAILLGAAVFLLVKNHLEADKLPDGQNYSTEDSLG